MGIVEQGLLPRPVITLAAAGRVWSLWGLPAVSGCCGTEVEAALRSPRWDASRLGIQPVDGCPAHADVLVVAGPIDDRMGQSLQGLLDSMPRPRYVMAVGACAISGGLFAGGAVGADGLASAGSPGPRALPVDVWVPGCPPRPEAILHGLTALQDAIRAEDPAARWVAGNAAQTLAAPRVVGGDGSTVVYAVRPFNGAGDPVEVDMAVDSGALLTARALMGRLHRSAEQVAETHPWEIAPLLASRLDAVGSSARCTALIGAIEALAGIEPPRRARWVRALSTELDRIASLIARTTTLARVLAVPAVETSGWLALEVARDRVEALTGSRIHHDTIVVGGVGVDVDERWLADTRDAVDVWRHWVDDAQRLLLDVGWVRRRLSGIGIVGSTTAMGLGITGPTLRAAGVAHDLRADAASGGVEPWSALGIELLDTTPPLAPGDPAAGDALARARARVHEVGMACDVVEALTDTMPGGPVRMTIDDPATIPAGIADEWADHPEGDVGCLVVSNGGSLPWRVHFQVPSIAARAAVPLALADAEASEVDVVLATLPLAAGEADR